MPYLTSIYCIAGCLFAFSAEFSEAILSYSNRFLGFLRDLGIGNFVLDKVQWRNGR